MQIMLDEQLAEHRIDGRHSTRSMTLSGRDATPITKACNHKIASNNSAVELFNRPMALPRGLEPLFSP
jgi:hypothetical protein